MMDMIPEFDAEKLDALLRDLPMPDNAEVVDLHWMRQFRYVLHSMLYICCYITHYITRYITCYIGISHKFTNFR